MVNTFRPRVSEAVRSSYRERWGAPGQKARFGVTSVWSWPAAVNDQGVDVLATLGAAREPVPVRSGHRVEYLLGLTPAPAGAPAALAALADRARGRPGPLDHGVTLTLDRPLWPGTAMDRFLLLRFDPPVLPPRRLADGSHLEFLQAVPLHPSEHRFATENGTQTLLQVWQESGHPFWAADRPPLP